MAIIIFARFLFRQLFKTSDSINNSKNEILNHPRLIILQIIQDQLEKLYSRTREEVEEEEYLIEELRKIEIRRKEREKKQQV